MSDIPLFPRLVGQAWRLWDTVPWWRVAVLSTLTATAVWIFAPAAPVSPSSFSAPAGGGAALGPPLPYAPTAPQSHTGPALSPAHIPVPTIAPSRSSPQELTINAPPTAPHARASSRESAPVEALPPSRPQQEN